MQTFLRRVVEYSEMGLAVIAPLDPLRVAAYQLVFGTGAAKRLGVGPEQMVSTPGLEQAFMALEQAVRHRVTTSGDADALTLAKVEAPAAMLRVVDLAKSAPDARTKLAANDKILSLAGVVAPKAPEGRTPEDLIDEMTPAELDAYASTGTWPARFGDHMRRLQLQRQLKQRGAITVEIETIDEEA